VSKEKVTGIFKEVFDAYIVQSGKAWRTFFKDFTQIWSDVFDQSFLSLLFGGAVRGTVLGLILTAEALQELGQDLSLVPIRVLTATAVRHVPLPSEVSNRVIRMDVAVRGIIGLMFKAGIQIIDGDMPVELDVALKIAKAGELAQLRREFSIAAALSLAKKTIVTAVVLGAIGFFKWMLGLSVILTGAVVYIAMWTVKGRARVLALALPQSNARETVTGSVRRRIRSDEPPEALN